MHKLQYIYSWENSSNIRSRKLEIYTGILSLSELFISKTMRKTCIACFIRNESNLVFPVHYRPFSRVGNKTPLNRFCCCCCSCVDKNLYAIWLSDLWADSTVAATRDRSLCRHWSWQWTIRQWWKSATQHRTIINCHTAQRCVDHW